MIFAQTDSSNISAGDIIHHDLSKIGRDAGNIFTAPFHFNQDGWITTAAIVGGAVILFAADEPLRSVAQRNKSQLGNNIFEVGRQYGREIYGLSLAGGLYAGGLVFKNESVRTTGLMLFESVAMAGAINVIFKTVIGRSRPPAEEGAFKYRGFQFSYEHTSMPSGHSTVAFSVSSVLARRLNNTYASIGLFSLATLTAVSRVYHDNHWVSDAFLGAALGTAVGLSVSQEQNNEMRSSIRLVPLLYGLRVEYSL